MADTNEIHKLLQIVDLSKGWPNLRAIHNRAMEKLEQIAKEPHEEKEATPRPPVPRFGVGR